MTGARPPAVAVWPLVLLLVAALLPLGRPGQAAAIDIPSPCDVPGVSVACDAVGDAAGAAAGAAGDAILGQLTSWVGDGAAWLLRQVAAAIDSTTAIDLTAPWFESHYGFMFQVGAILLLPLVLLTVLQALLRQDAWLLVRLVLLYLPAAMLITGLAVAVLHACWRLLGHRAHPSRSEVCRASRSTSSITSSSPQGRPGTRSSTTEPRRSQA